jgi:hypothetical protein
MCGGQLVHVVPLPVGGFVSVKARTIPGRHPAFDKPDGVPGEIGRFGGRTTASGGSGKHNDQQEESDRREPGAWEPPGHT